MFKIQVIKRFEFLFFSHLDFITVDEIDVIILHAAPTELEIYRSSEF
jgi:hypothetical protein